MVPFIVLGSGGARNVPADFGPSKGMQQFIGFCQQLGDLIKDCHIAILLEPLNKQAHKGTEKQFNGTRYALPAAGGTQLRGVAAASRGRPWLRASGRSAHAKVNGTPCYAPHIFQAWASQWHAPRDAARSYVEWLPRLAAGRGCVPLAAVPMQK